METAISEIISANTSNSLVHSVIKSWKSYDLSKYVNCQGLNSLVKCVIGNHESFKSQSMQIKFHFRLDFKIMHSMQTVSWHWIKTTNIKKNPKTFIALRFFDEPLGAVHKGCHHFRGGRGCLIEDVWGHEGVRGLEDRDITTFQKGLGDQWTIFKDF